MNWSTAYIRESFPCFSLKTMPETGLPKRLMTRFMRVFFYLLYHKFAGSYDWVAAIVSLGKWNQWVSSILPNITGPRVLELGYGTGHLQTSLHRQGIGTFGIDASPQMGRIASKRLRQAVNMPNLIHGYAQYLPFPDDFFNQIVVTFPSEYILDHRIFSEAHRVLAPGGEIIILYLVWITGSTWPERAAAWLFRISGQTLTGEDLALPSLQHPYFHIHYKKIVHPSWSAWVLTATKISP